PRAHPHLLYPQFKQVAHPSISTSALVEHLWHIVALGGKLAPSPVTAMSSCWPASPTIAPPISPAAATSAFFFERSSNARRFSAISARVCSLISGSCSMPIDLRWSSTILPSSATSDGMYTPPALK